MYLNFNSALLTA